MPQFDVFLSHSSEDKPWVVKLKDDLQMYGVSVWLDQDEIRPGDQFIEALEHGLAQSSAVALIVSPVAMASGWVRREYYRALSLATTKQPPVQLIPVILKEAELPDFAKDLNWVDFRDESVYDQKVSELVWGIIGYKLTHVLDLSSPDLAQVIANKMEKVLKEFDIFPENVSEWKEFYQHLNELHKAAIRFDLYVDENNGLGSKAGRLWKDCRKEVENLATFARTIEYIWPEPYHEKENGEWGGPPWMKIAESGKEIEETLRSGKYKPDLLVNSAADFELLCYRYLTEAEGKLFREVEALYTLQIDIRRILGEA